MDTELSRTHRDAAIGLWRWIHPRLVGSSCAIASLIAASGGLQIHAANVVQLDELFNPTGSEIGIDWQSVLGGSAASSLIKDADPGPGFGTGYDSGQVDFIDAATGTPGTPDGTWDIRVQYTEPRADFPNFTASGSGRDRFNPSSSTNVSGAFEVNDQVEQGAAFASRNIQEVRVIFGPGLIVEAADLEIFVENLNSKGNRHEWASIEILSASTTSWSDTGPDMFLEDLYETILGSQLGGSGSLTPGKGGPGGENGDIVGWYFATDDNTDSGSAAQQGGTALQVGPTSGTPDFTYVTTGNSGTGASDGSDGAANAGSFTGDATGLSATETVSGFVWRQYVDEVDTFTGDSAGTYLARLDFTLNNVVSVPEPSGFLLFAILGIARMGERWIRRRC